MLHFFCFFPFYCPLWCWKCVLISYIMYISISQINYAFSCWFSCCSCNLLIFDWYFRLALSKASLSVLKRRERERIKKKCKKSRTLREVNCCDIHNKGRSSIHSVKYRLTYESDPFFPHEHPVHELNAKKWRQKRTLQCFRRLFCDIW